MKLYLIRHGQSENNLLAEAGPAGRASRTADPALTETGRTQAQRVADYLRETADKTNQRDGAEEKVGHGIRRLYCSAMRRTLQTTQPISAALGLSPEVWLDVHEEGGIWRDNQDGRGRVRLSGLTRSEIEAEFPGFVLPDGVNEAGWWNRPMEARAQMVARAGNVAAEIRDRFAGSQDHVAIVSHGTFLNFLIHHLLHGRHMPGSHFSNHNTAITRVDFADGEVSLRYLNRVDHLPHELVT